MSGVTQKEAHEKGKGQGGCALVSASRKTQCLKQLTRLCYLVMSNYMFLADWK